MSGAHKIVAPFLQGAHAGKHFFVMDVVVILDITERSGIKCNRMPFSIVLNLRENSTSCIIGAICFNTKGLIVSRHR